MIARAHLNSCADCRGWVAAYRTDRESLRPLATAMPAGVNWDRLALEMSADIRVGLAAVGAGRLRAVGMADAE